MPPILTPFKSNYEIDEDGLRKNIGFWIENKVDGIIPSGSTGEASRLSYDERKRLYDIVIDEVNGRVPVLCGTGCPGTRDVIALSKYAEDAGADGVMVVAPFYGSLDDDMIYNHYKTISESINIPIAIYNNPGMSGNDVRPEVVARLAKLHNIRCVKEAACDSKRITQILKLTEGSITVMIGTDDNSYEAFVLGAKGWVSGAANFMPRINHELFELTRKKEWEKARELFYKVVGVYYMTESPEPGRWIPIIKAGAEIVGISAGPPRPPLVPLDESRKEKLKKEMTKAGVI